MRLATGYAKASNMPMYVPRAGDGCVLWLPGQDDPQSSTIRDRSGKGNNGTIVGATWTRISSGLWCLDFDGTDDEVDCGNTGNIFDITATLCIEVWVRVDGNTGAHRAIIEKGLQTEDKAYALRIDTDNKFVWDGFRTARYTLLSDSALTEGQWYHLRGVSLVGDQRLYVDDVLQASTDTGVGNLTVSTTNLFLGEAGGTVWDYNGLIALPRINTLEVPSHYQEEKHLFGV